VARSTSHVFVQKILKEIKIIKPQWTNPRRHAKVEVLIQKIAREEEKKA
jgi:hypothetical protein